MSSSFEFPELVAPRPPGEALEAAVEERRQALEAARDEGFAAGLAAAREEVGPAVEALAAELALQVAAKVLGATLEVRPELVVEVTRGALRRLSEPVEATLLVNPDDAERIREALADLSAEHGATLAVRAERRVDRGGCVVRTGAGEVDARVGAQLDRAAEIVREGLGA